MRGYFLAVATLVAVCVGCQSGRVLTRQDCDTPRDEEIAGESAGGGGEAPAFRGRRKNYVAPPAEYLVRPGPMVDGPGPGVLQALASSPGMVGGPGCPPGGGYGPAGFGGPGFAVAATQVKFIGPEGMAIGWQISQGYADHQIVAPGVYDFDQGAAYRLKLSGIPDFEGLVLYPTLQVYPTHPETDAFLAHNSVPLQITAEDLEQVRANNFLTKVIFLPSPKNQPFAIAGVETIVSTRLDPGVDPVAEADRRGTIMAVLRIGNKDLATVPMVGSGGGGGAMQQAAHEVTVDGTTGATAAPVPIGGAPNYGRGIPSTMMVAGPGGFGTPSRHPISGPGGMTWGYPRTGTPIGLPGPTHLPYGAPAGLKSHTVRNRTPNQIPDPVDHMLIDVKHYPAIKMPRPVKYIEYEETHPIGCENRVDGYGAGVNGGVNAGGAGYGAGAGDGAACPPQGYPQ